MTLANTLDIYNNLPDEEILGTFWYIEIIDNFDNKIKSSDSKYNLGNGVSDKYIHSVDIPYGEISFEKNSWGQLNAKEYSPSGEFSITFTSNIKANMLKFFEDWLDSIFDKKTFRFRSDYRKQDKNLKVYSFRPFNVQLSSVNEFVASSMGNQIAMFNSFDKVIGDGSKQFNRNTNIYISAIYSMECVYPTKLEDISFSDEDSDRKEFTLTCDCVNIDKVYDPNNL